MGLERVQPLFLVSFLLVAGAGMDLAVHAQSLFGSWDRPDVPEGNRIVTVSWHPRAFVYKGFISREEAKHIAEVAAVKMRRSLVVAANGSGVQDNYRTSYGTFIPRRFDPIITAVQERAAQWVKVPAWFQEDMQVLRYAHGQYYHKHMDSLVKDTPRLSTMLIYLSDPEEGGETAFPLSQWSDTRLREELGPFSGCVQGNVAFKPQLGDALLFWSVGLDGKTQDLHSEHEGCAVTKGVKWTATVWTHTAPHYYDYYKKVLAGEPIPPRVDPGLCHDDQSMCPTWAASGECQKNTAWMHEHCPAACKVCTSCVEEDTACRNKNREDMGYLIYDSQELQKIVQPDAEL